MTKVIGVRFRTAGKIYFFSPGKLEVETGDKVIVETARGVEFGSVVTGPKEVEDDKITQPLKSVIRLATDEDKKKEEMCIRDRARAAEGKVIDGSELTHEEESIGYDTKITRGEDLLTGYSKMCIRDRLTSLVQTIFEKITSESSGI